MDILYLTHPINGLLMILIPIGVGVYIGRKLKLGWGLWWAGGITFILSQVAHIPFNIIFLNPLIKNVTSSITAELPALFLASAMLGMSAGVFEETARYIAYRWWQKEARSWSKAVMFGAGHGSIEAILLGLLVLYTFLQMITLRGGDPVSRVPEEYVSLVQQQIDIYWSVPWHLSLLGSLERALTIPFHISAAVLVQQTFKRHQYRWFLLAIIWHAFVDALVVSAAQLWGVYAAEGLLLLLALISIGIILTFREISLEKAEELPPLKKPISIEKLTTFEASEEKLEESRYFK